MEILQQLRNETQPITTSHKKQITIKFTNTFYPEICNESLQCLCHSYCPRHTLNTPDDFIKRALWTANVFWRSILNEVVNKRASILISCAEFLRNRRVSIAKYCLSNACYTPPWTDWHGFTVADRWRLIIKACSQDNAGECTGNTDTRHTISTRSQDAVLLIVHPYDYYVLYHWRLPLENIIKADGMHVVIVYHWINEKSYG
jgi:hypothetical protein